MLKYRLCVDGGLDFNFSKMEVDKKRGFIYIWVNDVIITSFDPLEYGIKFKFKGEYSETYFFDFIKR